MIANIIMPMPMPIHTGASGNGDVMALVAAGISMFLLGLMLYIGGFLYDGLKHKSLDLLDCENMAKMLGVRIMGVVAGTTFIILVAIFIHTLLE